MNVLLEYIVILNLHLNALLEYFVCNMRIQNLIPITLRVHYFMSTIILNVLLGCFVCNSTRYIIACDSISTIYTERFIRVFCLQYSHQGIFFLTVFHHFLHYFMSTPIPLSGMKPSDYADL